MTERKELLAITQLICDDNDESGTHFEDKSDLDLLKYITERIKSTERPVPSSSSPHLDDSLAFPKATRDSIDLIAETELWTALDKFNDQLRQDYTCRRQMLLRRLDCTVESFKWKGTNVQNSQPQMGGDSKQAKSLNDTIHERYEEARRHLREEPLVTMAHLLAIRETECDKLLNGVISSDTVDCKINYQNDKSSTKSINLKHVIIPDVPDRGGRPEEHRPPPKETFASQRGGHSRDGRGRGGGRDHHGNRHHGSHRGKRN